MNPAYPYPYTIDWDDAKNLYKIYDRLQGEYKSSHKTYEDAVRRVHYYLFTAKRDA